MNNIDNLIINYPLRRPTAVRLGQAQWIQYNLLIMMEEDKRKIEGLGGRGSDWTAKDKGIEITRGVGSKCVPFLFILPETFEGVYTN